LFDENTHVYHRTTAAVCWTLALPGSSQQLQVHGPSWPGPRSGGAASGVAWAGRVKQLR
jgi:hypothetical protein